MLGTEQEQNSLSGQDADIDALFDSVYNSTVSGKVVNIDEQEKPEETPDESAEQTETVAEDTNTAAPAAEASDTEDPLKDLPESVRNYLKQKEQEAEEARKREAEWRQRYKSDEGRQAALQRKTQELERLLREKTQQVTPAQNSKLKIEETEEWKALSDSDPVLAKVLRGIAEESTRQAEEKAEARIKAATEPLYQEREQSYAEREAQRLQQMVPDLPLIVKDTNYHDWFDRQPESVRRMAESVSADDNFTVIKLFAMDRPDLFPAPQQTTTAVGASVTPAPQVDKLNQERQRKAQSQGVQTKIVAPPTELDEKALFEQYYKKTLNKR